MATDCTTASEDVAGGIGKDPANLVLAYLSCPQDAAKAYLGALLVTDARTRPLHFAFVSPVRPTAMQRVLYGPTLAEHVKVDVIAKKLIGDGLSTVPDVLFVDSEELISAWRVAGVATAFLSRRPQEENNSGTISLVRYISAKAEDEDFVGRVVALLEESVDLLDPFTRIQTALKEAIKGTPE